MVDRKTMLANAEQKIEEHPIATAAAGALAIFAAVKLASPKKEER